MNTPTKVGSGLSAVVFAFLLSQGYSITSPDGEPVFAAPPRVDLCAELPVVAENVHAVSVDIPKRGQRTRAINAGAQMAALVEPACELPQRERTPAICETTEDKDGLYTLGLQSLIEEGC